MTEVSQFYVIKDGKFTLERRGDDETLTFDLPDDVKIERYSVLYYKVNPTSGADRLEYTIKVNEHTAPSDVEVQVAQGSLRGGVFRSVHEALHAGILQHGSNTIRFDFVSGSGDVRFSDIILFYRRDV